MSSMLQSLKRILWVVLLAVGLQSSWAFSLLGPVGSSSALPAGNDDAWQQTIIGYNPLGNDAAPPGLVDPLLVGPKKLGEGYRRNTPVMYYACDYNFLTFFGTNGSVAVGQAFSILNSLTNVDKYSSSLTEFPLQTEIENYEAEALGLRDVKSTTLTLMMEQLGLADAVRYTWALHDRYQPPNTTCPVDTEYTVIMRNIDFTATSLSQIAYSPYINGALYTYLIDENCGAANVSPPDADALEFPADPLTDNPPVASGLGPDRLPLGFFYTGLTRDDVAGLRNLLSTNNFATENADTNSLQIITNGAPPFLLTTLSLGGLLSSSQTNPPDVLTTLYPGLVITSVSTNFGYTYTPNVITYLTNIIGAPAGSVRQVIATNGLTLTFVTNYVYVFGNIVTNRLTTSSLVKTQSISVSIPIGSPAGSPASTNTTTTTSTVKTTGGDFFIVPASWCGYVILTNFPSQTVYTTNVLIATSNTNQFGIAQFSKVTVSSYKDQTFVIQPLTCTNAFSIPQLRPGIGRIQFVQANFDSDLGQTFTPITNYYSATVVTNNQLSVQYFERVLTVPDFTFSAADLAPGPSAGPGIFPVGWSRDINFDTSAINNSAAGPGVIDTPTTIVYNNSGPFFENVGTAFLSQNNIQASLFIWGSFDATTNNPVVYPNNLSIQNLENQIIINVLPVPPNLPNATNGVAYVGVTFSATGGVPPYTWSLASGSNGLPPGLNLSSGGVISGTPTGAQSGIYDFTIQMTDSNNRSVQVDYSITVN